MSKLQTKKLSAFTLVELLLVIVILASISTMVIANLSFAEDRAGSAVTGSTIGQVTSNVEAYKTSTRSYPLGFDSLLADDGTGSLDIYDQLWGHSFGFGGFGPQYDYEVGTIDLRHAADASAQSGYASSLAHVFSSDSNGDVYIYDHSTTASRPGDSGTVQRVITDWGTAELAFVDKVAANGSSSGTLRKRVGYPNGIPTDVEIVAFGIGRNTGLRETMTNVPSHSENDGEEYYNRYIAYFAVFANGKQARLKAIVDSYGVDAEGNVEDYEEAAPEHE